MKVRFLFESFVYLVKCSQHGQLTLFLDGKLYHLSATHDRHCPLLQKCFLKPCSFFFRVLIQFVQVKTHSRHYPSQSSKTWNLSEAFVRSQGKESGVLPSSSEVYPTEHVCRYYQSRTARGTVLKRRGNINNSVEQTPVLLPTEI